jgi:hypothetical protein
VTAVVGPMRARYAVEMPLAQLKRIRAVHAAPKEGSPDWVH